MNRLIDNIRNRLDAAPSYDVLRDYFEAAVLVGDTDLPYADSIAQDAYQRAQHLIRPLVANARYGEAERYHTLAKRIALHLAPRHFDYYLQYVEWERRPEARFYLPRRDYLLRIVQAYQRVLDGELDLLTVSMPKRTGKAQPLYSNVLTYDGFAPMGSIKVGGTVYSSDGTPTVVTGVHPQGMKKVYRVSFRDGTHVDCCGEHLWAVRTQYDRGCNKSRVVSTEDMIGDLKLGADRHNKYSVDYVQPIEFEAKELPIAPYLMGVLLGDGSLVNGARFTNFEPDIVEKCRALLPPEERLVSYKEGTYAIVNAHDTQRVGPNLPPTKTLKALRGYSLFGRRSHEKHIPRDYLFSSVQDRLELLRGLVDTDGYAGNGNCIEYSTTSPDLRDGLVFLVRSLGGYASYAVRQGRYKKDGAHYAAKEYYRMQLCFPSTLVPVSSQKHLKKWNVKRKRLYHFVDRIEEIGVEECQCITVSHPSRQYVTDDFVLTHNSQTAINFVNMVSGRRPDKSTLMEGAGDALVKSFYAGCLEIMQSPDYLHFDVFPDPLVQTNADIKIINLANKSRFPTIMCRSIDASQVGLSEATNLLYLDDLVEGREEAMKRDRLDQKWEVLRGDVLGRRIEGTPIVATGTRYSLYDPIGRLQDTAREVGWRWDAIEIPALDLVTDESNYEHVRDGKRIFTTAYLQRERDLLSAEQWESEFQQQPFEAKGLMFPKDDLNYFYELPSDRTPDAIVAACDTAEKGTDSVSMPIAYLYGEDVLIPDLVFDNGPPEITKPLCAKKLVEHKVSTALFESNASGEYYSRDVDDLVKQQGGRVSIRTKRTVTNKQTRIEFASDGIKKHFYFLHPSKVVKGSPYQMFMREVTTHTRAGRVAHDDAVDSLSMLENMLRTLEGVRVEIIKRPF